MHPEYMSYFKTGFGYGRVYATALGVYKVELPESNAAPEATAAEKSSAVTQQAAELLEQYFAGKTVDFTTLPLDMTGYPPFFKRVLTAVAGISSGAVISYGDLARQCGSPGAARAVGGAMAANRTPIIIPCHRVVGKQGDMTGYSAAGGKEIKKVLLSLEGVEICGERVKKNVPVMHR